MDITKLPVPSDPTPTFSPEISSENRRSAYQRPKGSSTESMTEVKAEVEKTEPEPSKKDTPTTGAQDGSTKTEKVEKENNEEAWKTVGWFP